MLVKQGTFLFECWPDSAEKRDILSTGNLDVSGIGYGKFCSLVNCYSSVKAEHWIFRTVTYSWMGGIRRIGKLKINGIVSQSVIYVSGSTQGSEF